MTIYEYLQKIQQFQSREKAMMMDTTDIWSNDAAEGYAIAAMEAAALSHEQIQRVLEQFYGVFEELTIEEAEQEYVYYSQKYIHE